MSDFHVVEKIIDIQTELSYICSLRRQCLIKQKPLPDIFANFQMPQNCEMVRYCITDKAGTIKFLKVTGANMPSELVDFLDDKHKIRIEGEKDKYIVSEVIDMECREFDDFWGIAIRLII